MYFLKYSQFYFLYFQFYISTFVSLINNLLCQNTNTNENPRSLFLSRNFKLILERIWKCKGFRIDETILTKKRTKLVDLHSGLSTVNKTTIIKIVW